MSTGRGKYVAAGVGVLLLAGVVYAWSVLAVPIAAEFSEWSKAKLSVTFTPATAGFIHAVVKVAKPSTTVYVDPALTVA